jgi:hypothetical protein
MPEYLTLEEVAERIGVEVTSVRRAVKVMQSATKIEILKGRVPGRSRRALCVSDSDARLIVEHFDSRQSQTALAPGAALRVNLVAGGYGFFYIIQLIPEALPNRVKIGYTDNLDTRLKEHQTSAPTARLLKSWRCKRAWDQAAMDSIVQVDCHHVMNEVYEGDIAAFIARADAFFKVMPSGESTIPLSPHSPLKGRGGKDA